MYEVHSDKGHKVGYDENYALACKIADGFKKELANGRTTMMGRHWTRCGVANFHVIRIDTVYTTCTIDEATGEVRGVELDRSEDDAQAAIMAELDTLRDEATLAVVNYQCNSLEALKARDVLKVIMSNLLPEDKLLALRS